MSMVAVHVNPLIVFGVTCASVMIGGLWYSPLLFGSYWLKAMGYSPRELKRKRLNLGKLYLLSFLASLLTASVLDALLWQWNITSWLLGASIGFVLWLGFANTVNYSLWLFSDKPKQLFMINASYQLVALVLMGAVLARFN